MKKFLLVAFALVFAMTINAQTEIGYADDGDEWGAGDPDNTPLFHDGDYITWSAAFSDEWKSGGASYGTCLVNGEEVKASGAVGSNNPTRETITTTYDDGTIIEVAQGTPTGCAVFKFVPKQVDGYLYVFAKCNTNKNYVAYEEGTRIPYSFAAWRNGSSWSYDLMDIPGALDYDESVDGYYIKDTYTVNVAGYYTGDGFDETSGSVSGSDAQIAVIKFPVYMGCTYMFCGLGTKCAVGAYYFDTTGDATIVTGEDYGEATIYLNGVAQGTTRTDVIAAGIQSTVAETPATSSSATYNLAGQRVSKDSKGVVIMDGKKFIIK